MEKIRGQRSARDKASPEFWDRWWERSSLPAPIDPHLPGLKNYPFRRFHQYFERLFSGDHTDSMEMIEVGCAQSVHLPYFAKHFGFKVSGIDRSRTGCEAARALLQREGIQGDIYCADFFRAPEQLLQRFDVVVSFGVVEHFEPTEEAVRVMASLLKPEGRMITGIPNLTGLLGKYQSLLDWNIYSVHVPLSCDSLASAHRQAGLEIERCEYFLPINLEVLNVESWPKGFPSWFINRSHGAISRGMWFVDEHLVRIPPNRWTSPYIICVVRKPLGRT